MRTWAEINLDNLGHNVRKIRELSGGKEVMGVIKANAYGMGAIEYARELEKNGVKMLGVACYEEACELKDAGIEAEVLVFGCTPRESVETAFRIIPDIQGNFDWHTNNKVFAFLPNSDFEASTTYTVEVSTIAESEDNIQLERFYSYSFTTVSSLKK